MLLVKYDFDLRGDNVTEKDWEIFRLYFKDLNITISAISRGEEFNRMVFLNAKSIGIERLRYYVILDNALDKPIGIIPLALFNGDPEVETWEFNGTLFYAYYRPPCPAPLFQWFVTQVDIALEDPYLDPSYWKRTGLKPFTSERISGEFELPASFEEYIQNSRNRKKFKRSLRQNEDLRVEVDNKVRPEVYTAILPEYVKYWEARSGETYSDTHIKVQRDLDILALFPNNVLALYFYTPDNTLIAANYAWIHHDKIIVDMLCIRSMTEECNNRGVGVFAILKNIEETINRGFSRYTLTSSRDGSEVYKTQFAESFVPNYHVVLGSKVDLLFCKLGVYYKGQYIDSKETLKGIIESIPESEFERVLALVPDLEVSTREEALAQCEI